jgi:hypothetical protein
VDGAAADERGAALAHRGRRGGRHRRHGLARASGNHKLNSLWRLHAVHHSQEELSILTTFRAHPLVHVSFLVSSLPVLALIANDATPAAVLTVYACLGALPHANVRWTYGRAGLLFISPAYHRIHHSATGRLDINLGTVLTVWDAATRRAVFPARGAEPVVTGLTGRPVPVHIYYYNLIYKNIATIGNLFLVQIVASFILALALVLTRHVLVVLASAGLMAGTVIGFILVRAGTLFGFHLPFTSGLAAFVLVVEIVAVVLLAATALIMIRPQAVL